MRATLHFEDGPVIIDLAQGMSLAIDLHFDGPQPRAFGLSKATSSPLITKTFTTEVEQGGAVNCMQLTLWPHGNGTHTETVGHLLDDPSPIGHVHTGYHIAALVTLSPERLGDTQESYAAAALVTDRVLSLGALKRALTPLLEAHAPRPTALALRTSPNDPHVKQARDYSGTNPPYLTREAMHWVRHELAIEHVLLDLPSVDREEDDGGLLNHRRFWDVEEGATSLPESSSRRACTITEMIYAPDTLADGLYVLTIELPALMTDAAPSRPILYPIEKQNNSHTQQDH